MEFLNRTVQKFEREENTYILQGDFTKEEIHAFCSYFEMSPIVRRLTIGAPDCDFKIFLNEHITGIVSLAISKDPNTLACFNTPEFNALIQDVFMLAIQKGYKKLVWNETTLIVTEVYIQHVQETLGQQPDKKTQKQTIKIQRQTTKNNVRLH